MCVFRFFYYNQPVNIMKLILVKGRSGSFLIESIKGDDIALFSPKYEKEANLMIAAPELLSMVIQQYKELSNIRNQWPGRETMKGQKKLCDLRDLIAKATGQSAQEVQDN